MTAGTARWLEKFGYVPGNRACFASQLDGIGRRCAAYRRAGHATGLRRCGLGHGRGVDNQTPQERLFYIFRLGDRCEYVMTLALAGFGLSPNGPCVWSFDVTGLLYPPGRTGLTITAADGFLGSALLLVACGRPRAKQ